MVQKYRILPKWAEARIFGDKACFVSLVGSKFIKIYQNLDFLSNNADF